MGNCSSNVDQRGGVFSPIGEMPSFKIAVVGDPEVGKTSIIRRYTKNQYIEGYVQTKRGSIESSVMRINVPKKSIVRVAVWDVPGKEDLNMQKTYFAGLDAVMVVVDISSESAGENCGVWKNLVLSETNQENSQTPIPILLLGNKLDLDGDCHHGGPSESAGAVISDVTVESKDPPSEGMNGSNTESGVSNGLDYTEGQEGHPKCYHQLQDLVKQHGFMTGLLVSARDPNGSVYEAFQYLIRHLIHVRTHHDSPSNGEVKTEGDKLEGSPKAKKLKKHLGTTEFHLLHTTKLDDYDRYFKKCQHPMKEAYTLIEKAEVLTAKFYKVCSDEHFTQSVAGRRVSIKSCMEDVLKDLERRHVKLDNGEPQMSYFPIITFDVDSLPVDPDSFSKVIDFYNNQVRVVGNEIYDKALSLQNLFIGVVAKTERLRDDTKASLERTMEKEDLDECLSKIEENCMSLHHTASVLQRLRSENIAVREYIINKCGHSLVDWQMP